MDLLLLLNPILVNGGKGGKPGSNGYGGDGGKGGIGGSSYTYSTSTKLNIPDSSGASHTTYSTRWHTNPGGLDGPPGVPGNDGNA